MNRPDMDELRRELDGWRKRLDELRLKAHLGRKELAQKLNELGAELEPIQARARERLTALAKEGADEGQRIARSLQAGWEEVLRKHRDLQREAQGRARETGKGSEGES